MASALLNPLKKQKDIAKEFGYKNNSPISDFKKQFLLLFLNIRETNNEELFEADLDFLLENKDFSPILYNIWNQSKADVGNDYADEAYSPRCIIYPVTSF